MKLYALLSFFCLLCSFLNAQGTIDTTFYENELSRIKAIEGSAFQEAIDAYAQLGKKARSESYLKGQLQIKLGIARAHYSKGDYERSRKIADSVSKEASKSSLKELEGSAFYIKGQASFWLNLLYTATEEIITSAKISEGLSDTNAIIDAHKLLGNIYFVMGDYGESKKAHKKAMELSKALGNEWKYFINYYNYANCLLEDKKAKEALPLFNEMSQGLKELDTNNSLSLLCNVEQARVECLPVDKDVINEIYTNLSYLEKNKNRLARGDQDILTLNIALADYFLLTKKPDMAKDYLEKADSMTDIFSNYAEQKVLFLKSKYHNLLGNKDLAFQIYQEYDEKRLESTKNNERAKIHELNLRFERERRDKELASKDLELQLLEETREKERLYLIFIFGTVFLLGLGGLVLYLKNKNKLLDRAREEALQAAKTKSMFLDVITHELRTPLSTIAGSIYLLEGENDTKSRSGLMKAIRFSSEYLNKLIENTVLIKTLGDSKPATQPSETSLQRFNCRDLLAGICGQLVNSNNNNQLEISIDETIPKYIIGPELDLSRILVNLISNANKFTRNGHIKISVEKSMVTKENGLGITFTVSDNGDGIKDSEKDKVFDAFYSSETYKNEQYGGMGLGLNLVKGLLEKHGTLPKLESVYGLGTSISFTMEFEVPDTPHKQRPNSSDSKVSRPKGSILLVEDNKANQDMTKKIIERLGYHCEVADNGKMAIEKYKALPYSAVLMDMMMPVMNGFEATANINQLDPKATIIALTAVSKEKYADVFKELKIASVISKPVNVQIIKETLENHLDHGPWAA